MVVQSYRDIEMIVNDQLKIEGNRVIFRIPSLTQILKAKRINLRTARKIKKAVQRKYGDFHRLPAGKYAVDLLPEKAPTELELPEIIQEPTTNYSSRASQDIDTLILHYTVSSSAEGSVRWLKNPEAKASAHYLIGKDGRIFQMVDEAFKAWHAGVSFWKRMRGCNDFSIEIEIVNEGERAVKPFTEAQYDSLIPLCKSIIERHSIPAERILGHSDVAPQRKIDPGKYFEWERLALHGIGRLPPTVKRGKPIYEDFVLQTGDNDRRGTYGGKKVGKNLGYVQQLQNDLHTIGYRIAVDGDFGPKTEAVAEAFQRHYFRHNVTGKIDNATAIRIRAVLPQSEGT